MKRLILILLSIGLTASFALADSLADDIREEFKLDPSLRSSLINDVQITNNKGYVLLSVNCFKWSRSKTSNIMAVMNYESSCQKWLRNAVQTARNVKGVKKVSYWFNLIKKYTSFC